MTALADSLIALLELIHRCASANHPQVGQVADGAIRLEHLLEASLKRLEVLAESPWPERVCLIVVSHASTARTRQAIFENG